MERRVERKEAGKKTNYKRKKYNVLL